MVLLLSTLDSGGGPLYHFLSSCTLCNLKLTLKRGVFKTFLLPAPCDVGSPKPFGKNPYGLYRGQDDPHAGGPRLHPALLLQPFVERSSWGIRMFRDADFEWLRIIGCM